MKRQLATLGLLSLAMTQLAAGGIFASGNTKSDRKKEKKMEATCDESYCKEWNSGYRASEGYGAYISGSFILWQLIEEDMEVVETANSLSISGGTTTASASTTQLNTHYKPGFKVALGWNTGYDNWDFFGEYTWYHTGNMTTRVLAPGTFSGTSVANIAISGPVLIARPTGDSNFASNILIGNTASRTLNVKLDFLDLMLAKSFCFGQKLLFRPSFGGRGAWIRQKMSQNIQSNQPFFSDTFGSLTINNNTFSSTNKTISWGLGLKGALEADWMLGCGFKFFGMGAADLVYTRYNLSNTKFSQGISNGVAINETFSSTEKKAYFVRPHAELELGFKWGIHFTDCLYYFDLTAAYGFQVFWNQNMFLENTANPLPADNLYVQGLRVTALFAF